MFTPKELDELYVALGVAARIIGETAKMTKLRTKILYLIINNKQPEEKQPNGDEEDQSD